MKRIIFLSLLLAFGMTCRAREYHVSMKGNDNNTGSESAPFRTIGRAAQAAFPGDVITVYAGVYREWVNPPRGGENDDRRIVYRAAPGERVEIKGSERIATWEKVQNGVWKATLPNTFFGDYNPYVDLIYGDWFSDHGRKHHTGEVFLNDKSLYEKETLEKVLNPEANPNIIDPEGSTYTWYCETDEQKTTIWANFHEFDPNRELVEISVRRTCFYPEKQGINYLTIQGFHISQAATQWAAPTAEQIGMIATHWNKGWIIENNVISNSKCSGITLGKERGTGHNVWLADRSYDGSLHYIEVTFRTLRNGWNKENIGSHIVRNNEIFACEQTGICGSMGAAFSQITNNYIHDIWVKRQFAGHEIAGIKFHAPIDVLLANNRIRNCGLGIWLDWMTQGARISSNLLYHNSHQDVFLEVNHGPFIVDNNIMLSHQSVQENSQGGAYVHNLFAGTFRTVPDSRSIPYFLPHSTEMAGFENILNGDNRFHNNIFVGNSTLSQPVGTRGHGLIVYNIARQPIETGGNVYCNGAQPYQNEIDYAMDVDFNPAIRVEEKGEEVWLHFNLDGFKGKMPSTRFVATAMLGKTKLVEAIFDNPDGSALSIDKDYFGNKRSTNAPTPGPIEKLDPSVKSIIVWK